VALYAYDHELARAATASNPLLGEIRLTWWREVLDEIFEARPVRRHPTAQALAEAVARRGLERAPLEAMIDARYRMLDATPLSAAEAIALADAAPPGTPRLAGAWTLSRLLLKTRIAEAERPAVVAEVRRRLAAPVLPPDLLPLAAHATFARSYLEGRELSALEKRLRLIWAVARGRV
jgi:15-cis-phytoene synthase